jgi:hypothetical protein
VGSKDFEWEEEEEGVPVVELRKSWREGPRFPKTMCFFFFLSVGAVVLEEVVVEADWLLLLLLLAEESEEEVGGGTRVLVVVASPRWWETRFRLRASLHALVVSIVPGGSEGRAEGVRRK